MRRALLGIVTTAGVTLGLAAPAAAANWVVDPDGQATFADCTSATPTPYTTIQSAVNAGTTLAGDTIRVCPGIYAENVNVSKDLTLIGEQDGVDARDGRPAAVETIVRGAFLGGPGHRTTSFNVTADGVTIDGFTVQEANGASNDTPGILLAPATSGSEILNNIVKFNDIGLVAANDSATGQTVIQRNLFASNNPNADGDGIRSSAIQNALIDQNHFFDNANVAIGFNSTSTGSQSDVTMSANTFVENGRALLSRNLVDSTFTNNEVTQSRAGAGSGDLHLLEGTSNLDITQNLLYGGATNGIDAVRIDNLGTGAPNATDVSLSCNSIENHPTGDGLELVAGTYTGALNAEGNWWWDPSGPNHPDNASGTGEEIVDPDDLVDFTPWLVSGADTAPATTGFQCTPNAAENCTNGIDDDGDGLIDGADTVDCAPAADCFGAATPTGPPTSGNDVIFGTNGPDSISALAGRDRVCTFNGNDTAHGDGGNDRIGTGLGKDKAFGDAGADQLYGKENDDDLRGGASNDALDGGPGTDRCDGGSGFDTAHDCETLIGIEQVV